MNVNFDSWEIFFENIPFTYYRTSLIQNRYISEIINQVKLIRKVNPDKEIKLLEIAGGSGYTSAIIADLFKNDNVTVYFSDLSNKLCEYASKKFGLNSLIVDSMHIDVNNHFDIIFHQGFLEHFSDREIIALLREQSRVCDTIIFDVPNNRRWDRTQEFGNERFLSPNEWNNLTELAGLVVNKQTGRRLTNWWKKFVPKAMFDSELFNMYFGESTIIVCSN